MKNQSFKKGLMHFFDYSGLIFSCLESIWKKSMEKLRRDVARCKFICLFWYPDGSHRCSTSTIQM